MYAIFGQFGKVLDVNARRTYRLRGQAWVIFEKAEDAARAMELMQGFPFQDKPLVRGRRRRQRPSPARTSSGTQRSEDSVQLQASGMSASAPSLRRCISHPVQTPSPFLALYPPFLQRIALAKTKSDTIAKLDGTFRERPKVEQQKKGKAATGGNGRGAEGGRTSGLREQHRRRDSCTGGGGEAAADVTPPCGPHCCSCLTSPCLPPLLHPLQRRSSRKQSRRQRKQRLARPRRRRRGAHPPATISCLWRTCQVGTQHAQHESSSCVQR